MHRAWREFRRPSETVRSAYESGWVPFWVYIVTNALYFNDWRENIAAILRGQQLDYPQAPGRSQVLNPCAGFAPASGVHPHVAPPRDSCQPDKAWSANYQDNASGSLLKAGRNVAYRLLQRRELGSKTSPAGAQPRIADNSGQFSSPFRVLAGSNPPSVGPSASRHPPPTALHLHPSKNGPRDDVGRSPRPSARRRCRLQGSPSAVRQAHVVLDSSRIRKFATRLHNPEDDC